jgi:hypothetical protein
VGHAEYYVRLFKAMKFKHMALTFSGLKWMWRKKEYGRMYSGLKKVNKWQPLATRTKMIDGFAKMELDLE